MNLTTTTRRARGNRGAIPDQQWTDIWSTWPRERLEAWFAQAASWGPLNIVQAGQLMQGLPPQPYGWQYTRNCMVDAVECVARLKADLDSGAMPSAMTPPELARWCAAKRAAVAAELCRGAGQAWRCGCAI